MKRWIRCAAALFCVPALALSPLLTAAAPVGGGQASPTTPIKAYGCDMSFWNVGGYYPDYSRVDFKKMKADGCDFVILRVGFEGTGSRQNTIDDAFLNLYAQAKQAGLGVGAYFYALATTYEGAAEDAAWCIDLFEQHDLSFEYPIYYDIEDPGNGADRPGHDALNDDEMTALSLGWAQTLEAAGYFPGVYSDYETVVKLKPAYTDNYDIWYAYVAYVEGIPEFIPEEQDHSAFCGLWQYSWVGTFDGVVGDLDVNVAYKDYPTIMQTHGYNNITPVWSDSLSVMPAYEGLDAYEYNENGEGIAPTYHSDGTVTFTNTVSTASWSWPSAYMVCNRRIDLTQYPLLTIQKSGTSHLNAILSYITGDNAVHTLNLASLSGQAEFGSGDMTITANIQMELRRLGHLPSDGILDVIGITWYIMGAEHTYTTLHSASFTEPPFSAILTSDRYHIEDEFVSGISPLTTVAQLFLGFHDSRYLSVTDKNGIRLNSDDLIASGMTIVIEIDDLVLKTYTLSLRGDVNGDGAMGTMDAREMLNAISTTYTLNDWQLRAADFDANDSVTTADVRDLLLAIVE